MRARLLALAFAGLVLLVVLTLLAAVTASVREGRLVYRNLSPVVWLFHGQPVEATYTPTPIRSIQQVSITVNGVTSNTATISSIVTTASILLFQGNDTNEGGGNNESSDDARGTITNATTITATRGAVANQTVWNGVVVEFLPQFVKSQACGTIAIADAVGSNTATITAVVVANTILAYTGQSNAYNSAFGTSGENAFRSRITLTNTTTITATKVGGAQAGPVTLTPGYCYLEKR